MTTVATNPVHLWHWLPKAATVKLIGWMFALVAASLSAADGISTDSSSEGPAQTAYAPEKGPGPAIIVISGATGPAAYQTYAAELARLGYYSVLLDGKDIVNRAQTGAANLMKAIDRAQRSPHVVPGKVAVIGFSLGGSGALAHAAGLPDLVSVVVAYYPFTSAWKNVGAFVKNFRVPVLFLAAELDRYNNCCVIETARAIEAAAKESGAKFELVVYPQADHGFNLESGATGKSGRAYRHDDAVDASRRTVEMLRLHHPVR